MVSIMTQNAGQPEGGHEKAGSRPWRDGLPARNGNSLRQSLRSSASISSLVGIVPCG